MLFSFYNRKQVNFPVEKSRRKLYPGEKLLVYWS